MTILQLIEILRTIPDKTNKVWIESLNGFTSDIGFSIDDSNDIRLFQITENANNNINIELEKIQNADIGIN